MSIHCARGIDTWRFDKQAINYSKFVTDDQKGFDFSYHVDYGSVLDENTTGG